jgi:hypothetical protein
MAVLGRQTAGKTFVFVAAVHIPLVQGELTLASAGLDGRLMVIPVFV